MFRLHEINKTLVEAILKKKLFSERLVPTSITEEPTRCIVDPNYRPFADLKVGVAFGMYDEPIERIEIQSGDAPTPKWFSPKDHPGHIAVHDPLGTSVFLALTVDRERRAAVHPFDTRILANAIATPSQGNLFEGF
jgi:hypothetical protein